MPVSPLWREWGPWALAGARTIVKGVSSAV
jgi:hypothetical protein